MQIKLILHMKAFALGLVLRVRVFGTLLPVISRPLCNSNNERNLLWAREKKAK